MTKTMLLILSTSTRHMRGAHIQVQYICTYTKKTINDICLYQNNLKVIQIIWGITTFVDIFVFKVIVSTHTSNLGFSNYKYYLCSLISIYILQHYLGCFLQPVRMRASPNNCSQIEEIKRIEQNVKLMLRLHKVKPSTEKRSQHAPSSSDSIPMEQH